MEPKKRKMGESGEPTHFTLSSWDSTRQSMRSSAPAPTSQLPGSTDSRGASCQCFKLLHGVEAVQGAPVQRTPQRENSRKTDGENMKLS